MLSRIRHILEMIRFSHTLFALPFALLAALMAWHLNEYQNLTRHIILTPAASQSGFTIVNSPDIPPNFRWQDLVGILVCMVAGRSAAMAFNRLADRKIDALNPRTAQRHLPAGILSVTSVATFAVISSIAFIASTLIFLPNRLPLYLSVPMLLFLLGYSYAKRFTALAHFWLGGALGLAPVMAWVAVRGQIVMVKPLDLLPVIVLGGAVKLWVAGFDIIYACQDVDFDRDQHLHSIPARFGVNAALDIASTCHLGMVVLLAALPFVYPLRDSIVWWAGIAAIACLLVYEHSLVKPNDLARVNKAFFNVNAFVSIGTLALGAVAIWI